MCLETLWIYFTTYIGLRFSLSRALSLSHQVRQVKCPFRKQYMAMPDQQKKSSETAPFKLLGARVRIYMAFQTGLAYL